MAGSLKLLLRRIKFSETTKVDGIMVWAKGEDPNPTWSTIELGFLFYQLDNCS